jgi:hypothetical protein
MSGDLMWDFPGSTQAQSETHPSLSCSPRKDPWGEERESLAAVLSGDGKGRVELDNRTPPGSVQQQMDEVSLRRVTIWDALTHMQRICLHDEERR